MENYEHIYYLNCPHFTVGRVDQWGEQGFLFHEGHVYEYTEDRKDQWGRTFNQMSIAEFYDLVKSRGLEVPDAFLAKLNEE